MEPVSDFLARTLIEQTFKTNKDKKQQPFEREYKNHQKSQNKKPKLDKNALNTESELSVERRRSDERRQTRQQQRRFDLRTKHDRRQNSAFSLKI